MKQKYIFVSWSTSESRVRLALWNQFKPSSKIFYWPFQGGTSFVDLLCFVLSFVCYGFVHVCLYVPCGHLLGKGWHLGSCLWGLNVSLSLSHSYPWSGVVLDCIDSWSLHPYLLSLNLTEKSIEKYLLEMMTFNLNAKSQILEHCMYLYIKICKFVVNKMCLKQTPYIVYILDKTYL